MPDDKSRTTVKDALIKCARANFVTESPAGWGDKKDEWSARITAAHPMLTGDHDTYAKATEMVGNRHSKAALVELVNWLLKGQP